jgi:hypothetical protein
VLEQQQQADQDLVSAVLELAAAQLKVVGTLISSAASTTTRSSNNHSWLSSSRELGSVALPAARLAAAVLAASTRVEDIHMAVNIAMDLCKGLNKETRFHADSGADTTPEDQYSLTPPVQQLLQSTELLRLLAAAHALHVQHLACLQCANSSSSSSSSMGIACLWCFAGTLCKSLSHGIALQTMQRHLSAK